ncbi:Tol-Pal system peptidoglycan-associated lipoprotein PAL [hydrothermal vent metagenome]|uniref:Tol-Pal system peptidoglycan-associated lipoprotein PAL n=1 Tax=hydrothermal vent metagenome TaxID=652676 RepID=A0A3B0QSQ6_9ZZZZ
MKRNFMVFVLALMLGAFTFAGCATQSGGTKGVISSGGEESGADVTRGVGVQEQGKVYSSSLDKSFDADKDKDGTIYDVFFAYDKYALSSQSRDILDSNAKILIRNKGAKVTVEGHCDERGSDEYNIALGDRRARSVKKYLVRLGVDENTISTVSYGEEKPFCKGSGEKCWQKNRRAHFVVKY